MAADQGADVYAMPDLHESKLYDAVVKLCYEEQTGDGTAEKRSLRVACSAMTVATASEKFRRALDPQWSGAQKVLTLEVEGGQVEAYRHLLHFIHSRQTDAPWLPEGVQALVGMMHAAHVEMVDSALLAGASLLIRKWNRARMISADELADSARRLRSLDEAALALDVAGRAASGRGEVADALVKLRSAALVRILQELNPLDQHFRTPQDRDILTRLPLEAMEGLLASPHLSLDVEETALEAALFWLREAAGGLGEEEQRDAAVRLLRCVRWGQLQPCSAVVAWQRSRFVRLADPHRRLVTSVLLGRLLKGQPLIWHDQGAGGEGMWARRRHVKTAPLQTVFKVVGGPEKATCYSQSLYHLGIYWQVMVRWNDANPDHFSLALMAHQEADEPPAERAAADGALAAAAPLLCGPWVKLCLGLVPAALQGGGAEPPFQWQMQLAAVQVPMQPTEVEGEGAPNCLIGLSRSVSFAELQPTLLEQRLTWWSLWGPHSPYAERGVRVLLERVDRIAQ